MSGDWKFEPTDPGCGLKTFIGEAIGAASVCWDDMSGKGVFQSERAQTIVEAVYERAMSPDEARLGMASTADLLLELEARISSEPGYEDITRRIHAWRFGGLAEEILNYRTVDS